MTVEPIAAHNPDRPAPAAEPRSEFRRALAARSAPHLRPVGKSGTHELRSGAEIDPTMLALAELSGAAPARATVAQAKSDQVAQNASTAAKAEASDGSPRPMPSQVEARSMRHNSPSSSQSAPTGQITQGTGPNPPAAEVVKQQTPPPAASVSAAVRKPHHAQTLPPASSAMAVAATAGGAPAGKTAAPASGAPLPAVPRISGIAGKGLESSAPNVAKPAFAARVLRPADPDAFTAQVSRGLAAALRQNGGTVTIRMQPEALGDLKIRMGLDGGKVVAAFEVETEQARQLLGSSMDTLRSALEARGLSVDRLDVRVSEAAGSIAAAEHGRESGGAGVSGDGSAGRQDAGRGSSGAGPARMPSDREPEPVEPAEMQGPWMGVEWGGALRLDALA